MKPTSPAGNAPLWPMRINKYLAHKKHSTRVGADVLIKEGKVFINGRRAVLGDKVMEGDDVEVKGSAKRVASYVYYAYHKPRGIVTHSAQGDDDDIEDVMKRVPELRDTFPVGRLDKDSSGLILLTNDGRITDRLLNPEYEHEKQYKVTTKEKLRPSFKDAMEAGVNIEGYQTKPCTVKILGEKSFLVTLTEGKKHQIRRMVVALHNEVATLERTGIMNIRLGSLPKGMWRKIENEELNVLRASLGL